MTALNASSIETPNEVTEISVTGNYDGWVPNTSLLWDHRRILARVALCSVLLSALIAFLIPKQYQSTTRMMPPEPQGMGATMLAAMVGKAMPGALGALAGGMLGTKDSGALFVDLLQSGTIQGSLVDRFDLQKVYRKRYRQDTVKKLARRTEITQDRKSGVITIVVTDTDRERAQQMTQAYVDGLDNLLIKVNTSAARREREFIEHRLTVVQADLERAQIALSDFASKNTTLDIKEQTKAMVDAGAKLQAQLIVAHAEADSLGQFYGEGNVRMRAANARVGEIQRELKKLGGSATEPEGEGVNGEALYPSLRQLPILAVRWADLYRQVKVKETVYDLLTEQCELARIEEVKSVPSVRVIDPPSWPEKKSFPPRLLMILALTSLSVFTTAVFLVVEDRWQRLSQRDPRKQLAQRIWLTMKTEGLQFRHRAHGRLSSEE